MGKPSSTKISDLTFDDRNANKHSEFGTAQLEKGLRQNGLGRSILISSDNKIIAGNGVTESAGAIGIENVRIIETDGTEVIAVKRIDIKSGTKEFYQMALSDNIIAQANIVMDAEVTNAICEEYEIEDWNVEDKGVTDDGFNTDFTLKDGDKEPFQQMTFTLADAQAERIKQAIKDVEIQEGTQYGNENSNGNALHQIVLEWAEQKILS